MYEESFATMKQNANYRSNSGHYATSPIHTAASPSLPDTLQVADALEHNDASPKVVDPSTLSASFMKCGDYSDAQSVPGNYVLKHGASSNAGMTQEKRDSEIHSISTSRPPPNSPCVSSRPQSHTADDEASNKAVSSSGSTVGKMTEAQPEAAVLTAPTTEKATSPTTLISTKRKELV